MTAYELLRGRVQLNHMFSFRVILEKQCFQDLLLYVYVCVPECVLCTLHTCVQCLQWPGKGIGAFKIGVTDEPPDVNAGIQTQVLCKQPGS